MTAVLSTAFSGCCALGLLGVIYQVPLALTPPATIASSVGAWAGVWSRIIDALAATHDAAVQMIDTSTVRVHQRGACIRKGQRQLMGRSRGGLTSKIHAVVNAKGLPVRLALTRGETHDNRLAGKLLSRLKSGSMLLADRGYDADWIRELAMRRGAWATIPPKRNRSSPINFSPYLYRDRNRIERFFNRIKQCRRVQHARTNWLPTTLRSYSLRRSGCGYALMSPRPSSRNHRRATRSARETGVSFQ